MATVTQTRPTNSKAPANGRQPHTQAFDMIFGKPNHFYLNEAGKVVKRKLGEQAVRSLLRDGNVDRDEVARAVNQAMLQFPKGQQTGSISKAMVSIYVSALRKKGLAIQDGRLLKNAGRAGAPKLPDSKADSTPPPAMKKAKKKKARKGKYHYFGGQPAFTPSPMDIDITPAPMPHYPRRAAEIAGFGREELLHAKAYLAACGGDEERAGEVLAVMADIMAG